MPKPIHGDSDVRIFNKGANRDQDKELIQLSEGEYIDGRNIRVDAMNGESTVVRKINGETEIYPNVDNRCIGGTGSPLAETYECVGAETVNGHIVEFWADSAGELPSLIRINGKIVLMSEDFPIQTAFPLQIDKNESCIGGEIYITDFNVTPMIFNIEDLMKNSGMLEDSVCTSKYFEDFDISQVLLILSSPADHPVFIKLTTATAGIDKVFGTGGVPVGYYSYQIRYSTDSGDKTGWSVPTPQIPVVQRFTSECSPVYPYSQTISKDPDVANPSPYGVHIRFRVNNNTNFDFIEVRRNRWNVGDVLTAPPISEIIGFVDVTNGQIAVINVLDNGSGAESTLSPDEAIETLSAVNKAKAIRYFNNRLYLANIEYASRDAAEEIEIDGEITADAVFPTIQKMGIAGHKDPHKYAYNKSYPTGEKFGIGIVVYDENSAFSYARPIVGFENYQYPNRREQASALTVGSSYYGLVTAANTAGSISYTHEVFDTLNCVRKTDLCKFANILDVDNASAGKNRGQLESAASDLGESCPLDGDGTNINSHEVGYRPFTPVSQSDNDCSSTDMRINTYVGNVSGHVEYNPKGFGVDYFATGLGVKGVTGLPAWAKSFSMVRTKAAQRIVAQGLGFYSLNSAGGLVGANTTKNVNKIWFYAPDIDPSIGINPSIIDDIRASLSNYAIQCVSPLGFFTEVYSFMNKTIGADEGADIITYCRLLKDLIGSNAEINPDEHTGAGITDASRYYTAFGKWRNNGFNTNFPGAGNGNLLFDIADINVVYTGSGNRTSYLEITLTSSLYDSFGAGGPINGDNPAVQDWHEPVYIMNIVRKNIDVPDTNVTEYVRTGHYQKVSSLIGVSNGDNGQSFDLVDERWEDCMMTVNGVQSGLNDYDGLYRFIYVVDPVGTRRRWVNVASLSTGATNAILADLAAGGSAVVTDASGSYTVYGVYTQSEIVDGTAPVYSVVFAQFNTAYSVDFFIPVAGYTIYVDYDNRIPIRFFGGDSSTGEAICAFQDNKYNKNADPETGDDDFSINLAFPYREYELNKRIFIIKKTKLLMAPTENYIQDEETFKFDNNLGTARSRIRQLCAMFTCESRINLTYSFNDEATKHSSLQEFPLKNYVIRPYRWDSDKFGDGATAVYSDNNIHSTYEDDYGNEFELWGYGGFRFLPQVNIDYSKEDNSNAPITSVPDVGFEEKNRYCTRVIWSLARPINAQNTPSIRTYPGANIFDVSDDTGEIKYLFDDIGSKGNNLYAFTDRGIALLLVDKRVLTEISGSELGTIGSETQGILNQIWISKDIGMKDEMWRSAAEFQGAIFWCNDNSAYMFENGILDIGRQGYHSKLYPEYLSIVPPGYQGKVSAVYDQLHNEYWVTFGQRVQEQRVKRINGAANIMDSDVGLNQDLVLQPAAALGYIVLLGGPDNNGLTHPVTVCVDDTGHGAQVMLAYKDANGVTQSVVLLNEGECAYVVPYYNGERPDWYLSQKYDVPTLVYSARNKQWMGGFDYAFDKYVTIGNKTYGMRRMQTFELNSGFKINGENIEAELISASSKNLFEPKEFVRMRINSSTKPVKVEFFNNFVQALMGNVQAELNTVTNALALRDYNGFEQWIPRKLAPPYDRMQGRVLVYKVKHDLPEEFRIVSIDVISKKLR